MKNRSSWFVWTAFCNLILITGIYERTIKVDAAVQPSINDDGTINWGMFDPIEKSNLELSFDDIKHPEVLSDMSQGFVDFVVHGLPYETIRSVLIDLNDNGQIEDIGATTGELILGFIGVVILVLIGILLFFLVPLIGFCFCCCRCCGNCGGKREQVDSSLGCKRVTLSIIFVALLGILGAGMALTNTANDFQKASLGESEVALNTISDGVLNYTSDVLKQVKFMVDDQYGFVDELLRTNLIENTLATDVTTYIKQDLKLEEVTDDLDKLSEDLQSVETSFKNINEERSELIEQDNILKNDLTVIEQRIKAVNTSCPTCGIPEFNSQVNGNISQLPEISQDQINNVKGGVDTVDAVNKEIDDSLGVIETTISDETNQTAYEVIGELDEIQKIIDENFETVEDVLNDVNQAVKDVQKGYEENLESIDNWLNYRWWFFLGVTCSILFVLVLMILGFTMGTICYRKGSPRDRSSMSNCGGNCLMWTVFFMFVLFPILILLTCVMFAGFSLATATCTPLETFEIFEETIDYPDTITDGYFLGDIIYGNSSYEVTISGMLLACKEDETLYKAIKLDYLIDFDEMKKKFEDLEGQLDGLVGDIEDISLNLDGIIPADLQNELNDLISEVGIDDFDAEAYQKLLPETVLNGTDYLTSYADELDNIAATNPNQTTELNEIAEELRSLQTSVVDPMSQSVAHIESNISTVEHVNETLPASIDSTLDAAAEVEAAVSSVNETELVVNITEVYIKSVVNVGESYYDETTHQIENDFATCYNVYDIYHVGLLYTCGYVLSSGNALWFTIGWSVFFFLPSIIFSVKLAKHYRIMKKVRPPKQKKQSNNSNREDFGMDEMNNGYGHDERLLYPHRYGGGGGMTPVDNPQFIPDEGPIMAYDYKGNPIAPPPAYNHEGRQQGNLMRELLFSDKSVLPDIGPTLQRSQLAVRRAREEFRSFGRQYSFDDDDIIPCRQRPSLLSPFPWHRPINEHYPQRGKLWTRQSSSLEHLWPHPSWERQATIDLGGDDLLTPASILGRLPRQDRAFEEATPNLNPSLNRRKSILCSADSISFLPPPPDFFRSLSNASQTSHVFPSPPPFIITPPTPINFPPPPASFYTHAVIAAPQRGLFHQHSFSAPSILPTTEDPKSIPVPAPRVAPSSHASPPPSPPSTPPPPPPSPPPSPPSSPPPSQSPPPSRRAITSSMYANETADREREVILL